MNVFKGLGVLVVLAGIAVALTQLPNLDSAFLYLSIGIIAVSLLTYAASIRRSRRDRRLAGDRRRRA
ncbi:hypothetical protein [Kitasatospora cathayae]|uniref:DUF3188 domain-containing protein n=1 Tax=Kitasatospora cathayae TaxID=3004092 RepID=A0ABY7Q0Y4_9ACTN|nr:hypothetical protein [Kitasatospora sp. HUAS 3-15]WBP86124.1 hypothetical protein O1G21_09915 [Kitasatospora sp. HUAS 3-15]